MKYIEIGPSRLRVSNIIMGCMHLSELTEKEASVLIGTAQDMGVNLFDHADIYGDGECETLFARAIGMTDDKREKMFLQSKCGIVKCAGEDIGAYYDFSKEHILEAVEGSLGRLRTDYLDFLLLHRPDTLMEPEEIAEAFQALEDSGKVRCFGVSNMNPLQAELVQRAVRQPLIINQLQLSAAHTPMIDSGLTVNMKLPQSVERTDGILEYSRLKNMTIQAWSPLQQGFFGGPFLSDTEHYARLNRVVGEVAEKYGVTETAVAIAWITRHPARMQVVTGTTKPQRLRECCAGSDLPLTKREWYEIYAAAGNPIP